ncbi:hypothetical protein F4804DRAFT_347013 [Jackrogersella minutella]|nr:hypothetical protein F4804DRAFT_347013 [Jackrogersella minutella]
MHCSSLQRYFCGTCGCHVFQREQSSIGGDEGADGLWAVATGIIIGRAGTGAEANGEPVEDHDENNNPPLLRYARHVGTDSNGDGGLSLFIEAVGESREFEEHGQERETSSSTISEVKGNGGNILHAHCHCGTVRFHITRPDASSRIPHSGFPDLITPFAISPQEEITNLRGEKWWLRPVGHPNPTKYMAGTCASRSCRLTSGFEIQTWAFVPRSNIFFLPASGSTIMSLSAPMPLDFQTLPPGTLKSYESSTGVLREFCPRCGATVFWHDRWRPGIVDVSVGLLAASEGARAEQWLDWWYGRVSFEEDAGNGRVGEAASWARKLMGGLAEGLRRWEDRRNCDGPREG